MTAVEIRSYLRQLQAERDLASLETSVGCAAYVADLEEEIAAAREAYVATAVTEVATLRAELCGAHNG
jgi:hypothetical protein